MEEDNGIYELTLFLEEGKYAYKFIVDGEWMLDVNADEFVSDGFGGQNSIINVGDSQGLKNLRIVKFIHKPVSIVRDVYIVGSMNDWNQSADRMIEVENGIFSISLILKEGEYKYKFVEDGIRWIKDKNATFFENDGFEGENSLIIVDNNFEKVNIKKKDGFFLDHGIPKSQSIENINPLSSTKIEFKTKAHKNDVEEVFLIKGNERILMDKIADDGSFDYFQVIIPLKNDEKDFNYCFVYKDGKEEYFLLNGQISKINDRGKYFNYSKENFSIIDNPDWIKNGIIYQIFPDRFYNGDAQNNPNFSEWYYEGVNLPPKEGGLLNKYTQYFNFVDDWYDYSALTKSPFHKPDSSGFQPDYNSFYGGDIAGVRQKLDYLVDLGITIIYFNPLFEAKSNHKYDAVDYMKLDPHFGSEIDFKEFVTEAHNRGIRIIIDCAFNHTGETFWAFQEGLNQGPENKFYNWYEWKKWPLPENILTSRFKPLDYYECWWGFGEMPNLNFDLNVVNPLENSIKNIELAQPNWEVVNYILKVADYWMSDMDIDGFRLDVPNEVPFWFWKLFRQKVKSIKPDAYLVGEIWSNATEWVNNDYFDAVMNYAYFKDPVMRFFNTRKCDAKAFNQDIMQGLLSYPTQSSQVMMNLIGSHDTFRYLESANGDIESLKLAVLFQMTFIGVPHIWYGDEIGMMGGHDPDCRRPFNWKYIEDYQKVSLRDYYKKLIEIRKKYSCLRTGSFKTMVVDEMVYGYTRSDDSNSITIVINNDNREQIVKIPFNKNYVVELLTDKEFVVKDGVLEIEMDAMSSVVLK
jgi:glycosidase